MNSVKINPLALFSRTVVALCLAVVSFIWVISCGKDKDDTEPATTKSDLLKQKWNLVKELDTVVSNGTNQYTEYTGKTGDAYEFRTYGSLFIFKDGTTTSDPYKFNESNMTYTFYGYTYQVLVLTNNKLEIYNRTPIDTYGYFSQHVFLER